MYELCFIIKNKNNITIEALKNISDSNIIKSSSYNVACLKYLLKENSSDLV